MPSRHGDDRGIALRRISADDLALLDRVHDDVFDEPIDPVRRATWAKAEGHLMVVAIADGEVVGMCTAMIHHHVDKPTELYVDEVGVAEPFQRRGIGRRLLAEMFRWGAEHGCEEAWVGTEHDNIAARGLYESFGPEEADSAVFFVYALSKP